MKQTDILIIGSGMAGLSLAALLAQQGFAVTVVDREDPAVMASEAFDVRTVALSAGSRDILLPLGIWDNIVAQAEAITAINVQEGHEPFLLNFQARETASDAFGWIFPNHVVRGALHKVALAQGVRFVQGVLREIEYFPLSASPTQAGVPGNNGTRPPPAWGVREREGTPREKFSSSPISPAQAGVHKASGAMGPGSSPGRSEKENIPAPLQKGGNAGERVVAVLQDGTHITAPLLIGADGRFSRVRELAGVDGVTLPYQQAAWVGMVHHERPHHGLAVERFYDTGPFAVLPFTDDAKGQHRSAIVWTQDLGKRQKTLPVPDLATLGDKLAPLFDIRYGTVTPVGKWASYPLSLYHAKQMIGPRLALISDAAHAIHPIAGQGLNLGMRDVAALVDLLVQARDSGDDLGGDALLQSYQRQRRADVFAMVAATDMLNRLFGSKSRGLRWLRSAGLGIVDKIPPLKRFFMRTAMGK